MKLMMTPVNVLENEHEHPYALKGPRDSVKVTQVLDFWRSGGAWWLDEPPRDYYLLQLETDDIWEVFKSGDSWTLSRISD